MPPSEEKCSCSQLTSTASVPGTVGCFTGQGMGQTLLNPLSLLSWCPALVRVGSDVERVGANQAALQKPA